MTLPEAAAFFVLGAILFAVAFWKFVAAFLAVAAFARLFAKPRASR